MGLSRDHVRIYMRFACNLCPDHKFIISPWEHSDLSSTTVLSKDGSFWLLLLSSPPQPCPMSPQMALRQRRMGTESAFLVWLGVSLG